MKPCISEATTLPAPSPRTSPPTPTPAATAMEVWLTKLETHLETHSAADTRKLLEDRADDAGGRLVPGRPAAVAGRAAQGPLRPLPPPARPVPAASASPPCSSSPTSSRRWTQTALERAVVSLKQAAQWAAGFGVRLALEFRGSATLLLPASTRPWRWWRQCGEPNVGVNLDVFHYYTGPSKFEDLGLLTPAEPGLRAGVRPGRRAARAGRRRRPHPAGRRRLPAGADRASSSGRSAMTAGCRWS